jgi:hypothetical protein
LCGLRDEALDPDSVSATSAYGLRPTTVSRAAGGWSGDDASVKDAWAVPRLAALPPGTAARRFLRPQATCDKQLLRVGTG